MSNDLLNLIHSRTGHFVLESGHHADTWLDLELLCRQPQKLRPFVKELADRLKAFHPEVVCGPLVEGAFVGLMVADRLGIEFLYTEPTTEDSGTEDSGSEGSGSEGSGSEGSGSEGSGSEGSGSEGSGSDGSGSEGSGSDGSGSEGSGHDLFPVTYRLPAVFRHQVRGRRVAIVNDVINAGSAVRGSYSALMGCNAVPVVMAALLTLGHSAAMLAAEWQVDLIAIAAQPHTIWPPDECPLCRQGFPLSESPDR